MQTREIGRTGFHVFPVGFGAFKIGRNQGVKYPRGYELPNEAEVAELLNGVLDLGINLIDTAPAYGFSEERIGAAVAHRREEFTLSTKVGETFEDGRSTYDFSAVAIRQSVERSLRRLKTDVVDLLFLHSNGDDLKLLQETDAVETLLSLKAAGSAKAIGLSGKTVDGARKALAWADVLMVEYHRDDISHAAVIGEAAAAGVGVIVKKGLAAGRIPAGEAITFLLSNPGIAGVVIGGLNRDHLRANVETARAAPSQGRSVESDLCIGDASPPQ